MGEQMRELWLKVKKLGRDARRVKTATGAHAIVRVQKRAASKEDVARAAKHIMHEHRAALEWLADK